MPGRSVPATPKKIPYGGKPGRPKGVKGVVRPPGSDASAPLVREFEIAREVYKNTDLPMWVIKKVMKVFFSVMIQMFKEGKFIHIAKIGSFAPYRLWDRGWQRANREPTHTYLHYKWKVGKSLKEDIRQATTKEKDNDSRDVQDQDNDDMGDATQDAVHDGVQEEAGEEQD